LHRQHRDGVDQVNSKHDVAYDLDVVQCVPLLRLTLELSGGAAIRLNEMLDGCDAACSGDNDCRDGRTA
jgi:hypothetical protein